MVLPFVTSTNRGVTKGRTINVKYIICIRQWGVFKFWVRHTNLRKGLLLGTNCHMTTSYYDDMHAALLIQLQHNLGFVLTFPLLTFLQLNTHHSLERTMTHLHLLVT